MFDWVLDTSLNHSKQEFFHFLVFILIIGSKQVPKFYRLDFTGFAINNAKTNNLEPIFLEFIAR